MKVKSSKSVAHVREHHAKIIKVAAGAGVKPLFCVVFCDFFLFDFEVTGKKGEQRVVTTILLAAGMAAVVKTTAASRGTSGARVFSRMIKMMTIVGQMKLKFPFFSSLKMLFQTTNSRNIIICNFRSLSRNKVQLGYKVNSTVRVNMI